MNDRKGKILEDFQGVLTSQKTGKTGEIVGVKQAGLGVSKAPGTQRRSWSVMGSHR